MKTDFTIQPWSFKDTTANVTCNTAKARERMDGALSVDVQLSMLIGFVVRLKQAGFTTNALEGPGNTIVDEDFGKEHRVTLDNGVVTSYPRNCKAEATLYMQSLIEQGIGFSYSFEL